MGRVRCCFMCPLLIKESSVASDYIFLVDDACCCGGDIRLHHTLAHQINSRTKSRRRWKGRWTKGERRPAALIDTRHHLRIRVSRSPRRKRLRLTFAGILDQLRGLGTLERHVRCAVVGSPLVKTCLEELELAYILRSTLDTIPLRCVRLSTLRR